MRNIGIAPAGHFVVRITDHSRVTWEQAFEGLDAGESQCLEIEVDFGHIEIDANDEIVESDESNNGSYVDPHPTRAATCTPSVTHTATVTPTGTPAP